MVLPCRIVRFPRSGIYRRYAMDNHSITINSTDGKTFSAYVAEPSSSGSHPGLLIIQEIFGVNKTMRALADRYAKMGFLCVVPDLFWRLEPGLQLDDRVPEQEQKAFDLFGKFDMQKVWRT